MTTTSRPYMSPGQRKQLADIMKDRRILRTGKFNASYTKQRAQKEWQEIAEILNSLPGAQKSWKMWRKSWQDLLSKTKSKKRAIITSLNRTGGSQPIKILDEVETTIIKQEPEAESDIKVEVELTERMDPLEVLETSLSEEVTVIQIDEEDTPPPPSSQEKGNPKEVNIKSLMKEKLDIKRKLCEAKIKFFNDFIEEKKRQTAALEQIALALQRQNNVL